MEEIIKDRLYRIKLRCYQNISDGFVNVYYLKKENILVDAGFKTEENYEILKKCLNNLGINLFYIKGVILTHIHLDHSGLLEFFPKHIPIYCHENFKHLKDSKDFYEIEKNFLRNPHFSNNYIKVVKSEVDSSYAINLINKFNVYDIQTANIHKNIKILNLLGHTCLDICLEINELKIIFTGDLFVRGVLVDGMLDNKVINLKKNYIQTAYFLLKNKKNFLYLGGHGDAYSSEELKNEILKKIKKIKVYLLKTCNFLQEEQSLADLCYRLLPLLEKFSPYIQFSETYMIVYFLEEEGLLKISGDMIKCVEKDYKIKIDSIFDKYEFF